MPRTLLFAPGHNEKLLSKVFTARADVGPLDLEDSVPPHLKERARDLVGDIARQKSCWVRVNKPFTDDCRGDLEMLGGLTAGLRLPKVESAREVEWFAAQAPGVRLDCTIESARGVLAAFEIANCATCSSLAYGGLDLAADLRIAGGEQETLLARSLLVLACRAAGKPPPSDGVYAMLNDDEGLRIEVAVARRLGFFGRSAIHPPTGPNHQ